MGRSSQRHNREIHGIDSAGETPAQYGETYNNLQPGAGNPNDPAVQFVGTVANDTGNVSVAYSLDVSGFFFGSDQPFTYSLQAGTLPSGTTLGTSTGIISGTPDTITNYTGIVIRATDQSGDTADTNSFAIDILA